MRRYNRRMPFVIYRHIKLNRPATHLAIFNIVLMLNRAIDKNLYILAAIGALEISRRQQTHFRPLPDVCP